MMKLIVAADMFCRIIQLFVDEILNQKRNMAVKNFLGIIIIICRERKKENFIGQYPSPLSFSQVFISRLTKLERRRI